jgi:pimeloyl-ACP methyl ester carboxylesterase
MKRKAPQQYPCVILPGYLAAASDYFPLQAQLEAGGWPTRIVPLTVSSWFPTLGGRSVVPILKQLQSTIQSLQAEQGVTKINLIAHSAGGWIARIFLGDVPYFEETWSGRHRIATLITLGTPHTSCERWTRHNLDFVNSHYPGAFWPEIKYVCVAGTAIPGRRLPWTALRNAEARSTWLAYNSYRQTVGDGDRAGDGITPVAAAHLEGAVNITLEQVYHSPRGSKRWYGSPDVLSSWLPYLQ